MTRLLDLFCGAGGCAVGYARAGFTDIVGVDLHPQPHYPFVFVQGDALAYLRDHGHQFDAIHASPPCQAHSIATFSRGKARKDHADLIPATRDLLLSVGVPWVIENVPGCTLRAPAVMLCGLMFGLRLFRHRWFESSQFLLVPDHPSHAGKRIGEGGFCSVAGHGGRWTGYGESRREVPRDHRSVACWSRSMGIDWMTQSELAQAIPPAYTEFLGRQLIHQLVNLADPAP